MTGWLLRYDGFDPEAEPVREALCALGNGRFVTRAAAPEARPDEVHYPGTYAAGVFNRLADERSGRHDREREHRQPAGLAVVDVPRRGRRLGGPGDVDGHALRAGTRSAPRRADPPVPVEDAPGRRTAVAQRRVVSMADPYLACLDATFVAENWVGRADRPVGHRRSGHQQRGCPLPRASPTATCAWHCGASSRR